MGELVGVIYPVPVHLIQSIFSGGPKVFVKYLPHYSTRLNKGNKIIFYESRGSKCLIGEGVISSIEFLTPNEVLNNYRKLLFLSEKQFDDYVKLWPNRDPSKWMFTVKLTKINKYMNPIMYKNPITMAGRYISKEEYQKIIDIKSYRT